MSLLQVTDVDLVNLGKTSSLYVDNPCGIVGYD